MMKKEHLEDIKLLVEELTYEYVHDDTFYGLFVDINRESIDFLIEQAEIGVNADKDKQTLIKSNIELNARVQELEVKKDEFKKWWQDEAHYNNELIEQNKRYRKALEFYAKGKHVAYKLDETDDDLVVDYGETARKALEGDEK